MSDGPLFIQIIKKKLRILFICHSNLWRNTFWQTYFRRLQMINPMHTVPQYFTLIAAGTRRVTRASRCESNPIASSRSWHPDSEGKLCQNKSYHASSTGLMMWDWLMEVKKFVVIDNSDLRTSSVLVRESNFAKSIHSDCLDSM